MTRALYVTCCVVAASLAGVPSASAAFVFTVPGGTVDVRTFPGQPERVQSAVEDSLSYEVDPLPISAQRCPTGRVVITAEKQATLEKAARRGGIKQPKKFGGLLLRGKVGVDCRIYLNARVLRHLDEAQTCMLVQHELGHARGLDHTVAGLMAPTIRFFPDEEHCDWAWSELLED